MKLFSTTSLLIVLSLALSGCQTAPVQISQPVDSDAAAIVVKIPSTCLALMPCANKTLTFARLSDNGKNLLSKEIFQTAVVMDDHYYLLNAKPGWYVAVAAAYSRSTRSAAALGGGVSVTASRAFSENILFSEALVRQALVEVKPGTLAVMGTLDFSIEGRMSLAPSAAGFLEEADAVQQHYARTLDPDMASRGVTSAVKFYRGQYTSATQDAATRRTLLNHAELHIGAKGWREQILKAAK